VRWYKESLTESNTSLFPNPCTGCEYREPCHANFGFRSIDGAGDVGLYPFTDLALGNMARRARERSSDNAPLDPRAVLRDILGPVVDDHRASAIRSGDFPDENLVDNHGGYRLPLSLRDQIGAQTGVQAKRYRALLELWSLRPGEATKLPGELYSAFALSPLTLGEEQPEVLGNDTEPEAAQSPELRELTESAVPFAVSRRLKVIETWANGGHMTGVTNDLRGLVRDSVLAAIDWDKEGLERIVFSGSKGTARDSFSATSVDFARQDTRETSRAVKLRLPMFDDDDSQLRTAQALEALVNFQHYGHWQFPDSFSQMLALSEQLPLWAECIVAQLHRVHDRKRDWDVVASALEVLAVGATLASRPSAQDASAADRLEALLAQDWPAPDELQVRSDSWRALYRQIYGARSEIRELILAHASAMKGGQSGSMLDARRVSAPLRAICRDWRMRAFPPNQLAEADLPHRYRRLADLHGQVAEALPSVTEDERALRVAWLDALRAYIPDNVGRREVVEAVEQLLDAINAEGVPVRSDYHEKLVEVLGVFRVVQLDEAIRISQEMVGTDVPAYELLPRLASHRSGNAMRAWEEFREPIVRLLGDVESKIQSEREKVGGVQELAQQYSRVGTALASLELDLEKAASS